MASDISIVTPWLDHPEFIADYERAVGAPGVEVIVVDNASAEANAHAIREMVQRLGGKYIRNETNRWFAAANNQGLAAATGEIVVFLNNDIVGESAWLQQVLAEVKAGALYGPVLLEIEVDDCKINYHEGWCIAGVRSDWDRLGGWDAEAHSMPYWEDKDLGFRAASAGLELMRTDWPIRHKGQGTSDDVPGVRLGFERARENFFARVRGQRPAAPDAAMSTATDELEAAVALHCAGHLPEAEQAYRRLLDREPGRADVWVQYAQVLHLSGRAAAGIEALREAARLQPDWPETWINLGLMLGRMDHVTEAEDALKEAVRLAPHSAEAHTNLSRVLVQAGRYEQAVSEAREALRLRPGFGPAYLNLSNALRKLDRAGEAFAAAHAAAQAMPASSAPWVAVGDTLMAMRKLPQALAAYEQALRITPNDRVAARQCRELRQTLKSEK